MKNLFPLFFLFILVSNVSVSQILDLEHFKNLSIRNIGPAGMSGRVTAIDIDLSDSDRISIGSASGGVWMSENGGV